MSSSMSIRVEPNARKNEAGTGKPDHWADAAGTSFQNPWPSWRSASVWERIKLVASASTWKAPDAAKVQSEMPIQKPNWGQDAGLNGSATESGKLKATWLGHACFLVEFPIRSAGGPAAGGDLQQEKQLQQRRGLRVLFDPVFSDRCSPSQLVGPKRFTPPPCKMEDIPEFDAVVISHDHYDHLDVTTIRNLASRPSAPHFFAPLGNDGFFRSLGVPESRTHVMDWWDSKRLEISDSSASDNKAAVDITCTPAQHFSGRTPTSTYSTLWASWVVQEVVDDVAKTTAESQPADSLVSTSSGIRPPLKVFFGGDTGYRSVMDHQNEDEVPVCPAFREIGEKFGGFDVALIPIGAYQPRQFMSPIHCAPQDSVRLFKDIKAKKALGMHWGTWVLTSEDILEPPKRLREECRKLDIPDDDFTVCNIGQTMLF
ncbi:N-acyl-phosphatidylethanolamine-hydrolyzing phospholipase D [Coprinopsis sp. MPI-PUGE-AT-0042]|nr:N-acyl-phosphatidylethanolamine-hydrolyzing phospholipase D [Coprinopsis sp. MPI-PUGE-AT-0042]